MGAEEPALGMMGKTTGVGAAKVEGGLSSGRFMMNAEERMDTARHRA